MFLFNGCWHAVSTVLFDVGKARPRGSVVFGNVDVYPCKHVIGRAMSCDVERTRASTW